MMKKVMILEGSPRRNGSSAILSNEFARGPEEAGCRELPVFAETAAK